LKRKKKLSKIFELKCVWLPLVLLAFMVSFIGYLSLVFPVRNPDSYQRFQVFFNLINIRVFISCLIFFIVFFLVTTTIQGRLEVYESKKYKKKQEVESLESELSELYTFHENKDYLKSKMAGKRAEIDSLKRKMLKKSWLYRFIARKFRYIEE
jgi:hypothetical protein